MAAKGDYNRSSKIAALAIGVTAFGIPSFSAAAPADVCSVVLSQKAYNTQKSLK